MRPATRSSRIRLWAIRAAVALASAWLVGQLQESRAGARKTLHPLIDLDSLKFPRIPVVAGAARPEDCATCHEKAYRSWQRSLHAMAATGGLFPLGFAAEPLLWCGNCHSPEQPDPRRGPQRGVTCASCHLRQGGITTARPVLRQSAPHPLVHDPALSTGTLCLSCHQFEFPLMPMVSQDTGREWRKSGEPRCAACHMDAFGGCSHEFPGSRSAAFLERSIPIRAALAPGSGDRDLAIVVGPVAAGHRVPTGDPFRTLVVRWQVVDATGRTRAAGDDSFARQFRSTRLESGGTGVRELDNRLYPGERREIHHPVRVEGPGPHRVRLTATLELLPPRLARLPGFPATRVETPFSARSP